MPPALAAIPPASRKTLLEWIDHDDGDTTGTSQPETSPDLQALHTSVLAALHRSDHREPLQPPPGLRLAPLG
jgi:hypothetical protein